MGTIQCYSSYVSSRDDIALNAMSAGWMNAFVEIVLGASVVIPIAVGYLGMDWVQQNAGFMMAFKTMPFLFDQWGDILSVLAGIAWFGLLFFAGVTSSLAMGTPWMGFMEHEFKWSRNRSALTFGLGVLILALPTILFFHQGVFDEYDYWTGTVALVVFALAEIVLFAWVFGMERGWDEITRGSDIKVPIIFKYIIKYITPVFILFVFFGAVFRPVGDDWFAAFQALGSGSWPFHDTSILNQLFRFNLEEVIWFKDGIPTNIFFIDMSRFLLLATFIALCVLVRVASIRRKNEIPVEHK